MPRARRVFASGTTFHVACRTTAEGAVLTDVRVAEAFLGVLEAVTRRDGCRVLAWCLLPDAYHLALRCGQAPIWTTMRSLQGRSANEINALRCARGRLWRDRYRAMPIVKAAHLAELVAYVHARPVVRGLATEASAYRWSGHAELLGESEAKVLDLEEALETFGGAADIARRVYTTELERCLAAPWSRKGPGRLPWWRGASSAPVQGEELGRRLRGAEGWQPAAVSAAAFLDAATAVLDVTRESVASRYGGQRAARVRQLVALAAVECCRVRDLAGALGRHPGVVSRWISAARERRRTDPAFEREVDALVGEVSARLAPPAPAGTGFLPGAGDSFID
jgi:putative transposase